MKVILAHTLKPVEESRINLKIASSLKKIDGLEVLILGSSDFMEDPSERDEGISYKPIFSNRFRLWSRIWNSWLLLKTMRREKPMAIVVCSPDLLPAAITYKILWELVLVFDCQENMVLNLRFQTVYNNMKFRALSWLYSTFLAIAKRWIDRTWYAEQVYSEQIPELRKNAYVFENKVSDAWKELPVSPNHSHGLFFGGVITAESGAIRAIDFIDEWLKRFPDWKVSIYGFCPDKGLAAIIKGFALKNGIDCQIDEWVGSKTIAFKVNQSTAVLMPYLESPANQGKIPTKFYEALYLEKPVLVQEGGYFSQLAYRYKAGIEVDFENKVSNNWQECFQRIIEYVPFERETAAFLFESDLLRADFKQAIKKAKN